MTNQEAANKLNQILRAANIKTKEVTITRVTVTVKLFGQQAAIDTANLLNTTGQWKVKVYRPEENFSGCWKVGGMVANV